GEPDRIDVQDPATAGEGADRPDLGGPLVAEEHQPPHQLQRVVVPAPAEPHGPAAPAAPAPAPREAAPRRRAAPPRPPRAPAGARAVASRPRVSSRCAVIPGWGEEGS